MNKNLSNIIIRTATILMVMLTSFLPAGTIAISGADKKSIINDTVFYDPQVACASSAADTGKPVIALDPGHSGTSRQEPDPATGITDYDYPNTPEITEVWDVTNQVKDALTTAGYSVVLTKAAVNDTVSLRARADVANNAHAALGVSIHDDHGQSWDSFAKIYVQRMDGYRLKPDGTKVSFTNKDVADKSAAAGAIFATERSAAEGRPASVVVNSFDGRAPIAGGNLSLTELWANVPWVYNEVGAAPAGATLSADKIKSYATGLINSIKKAVPIAGGAAGATGATAAPAGCCPGDGGSTTLSGADVQAKVWNFFIGKGLKDFQVAGIMGNIQQESSFIVTDLQGPEKGVPAETLSDAQLSDRNLGWGLVQWTPPGKFINTQTPKTKANDLAVQLDFVWSQLTTGDEKPALDRIKASTDVPSAVIAWEKGYERCDPKWCDESKRLTNAAAAMAAAGGGGGGGAAGSTGSAGAGGCSASGPIANRIVQIAKAELGTVGYMKYTPNNENWCADFVSWVLNKAGVALTGGSLGGWDLPSVSNMADWFKANPARAQWFDNNGTNIPQPGDILIHGSDHVNIAVDVQGKTVTEVGGNQGCAGHSSGDHASSCVTTYPAPDITHSDVTGWGRMIQ